MNLHITSTSAKEAFDKSYTEAASKLSQIEAALEDFKATYQNDLKNWGYAGSMDHISNQLDEILTHLGIH